MRARSCRPRRSSLALSGRLFYFVRPASRSSSSSSRGVGRGGGSSCCAEDNKAEEEEEDDDEEENVTEVDDEDDDVGDEDEEVVDEAITIGPLFPSDILKEAASAPEVRAAAAAVVVL